ncbi:conserved hypothetical protein ['Nostoc azollae' 0708]|jgi:hypothetical protein|uniref:Uncharacterized protein n=1 Tax=Nostoc azollae (strain 0708) TaxID=551115 RepID=D7E488_NOSA0|nr:conserved hypothetical protein ['Nostoc azollae' 0708]
MKKDDQLVIEYVSPEVIQLIKVYAVVNNYTQAEILGRIVVEWQAQQRLSEKPRRNEDE